MQQLEDHGMAIVSAPAGHAIEIARSIVQDKLAACAQVSREVTSIYWWKGRIEEEPERLIVLKTRHSRIPGIQALLARIHPAEVPELTFLPITGGAPSYLEWMAEVLA